MHSNSERFATANAQQIGSEARQFGQRISAQNLRELAFTLGNIEVNLENCDYRYFISYSGVKLPLKLVNELADESHLENRNTYFRGCYDGEQRLMLLEKMVYGDVELRHVYSYHPNGLLAEAEITDADGEINTLCFDESGAPVQAD